MHIIENRQNVCNGLKGFLPSPKLHKYMYIASTCTFIYRVAYLAHLLRYLRHASCRKCVQIEQEIAADNLHFMSHYILLKHLAHLI